MDDTVMGVDLAQNIFQTPRAIALQKPCMRVLRKSLFHPAFLNLPRFEPLAGCALMMFKAMRLSVAKFAGA